MTDRVIRFIIIALLTYSGIILFQAYLAGADLGSWIWERHQNLFSWYSRPLFIIPACYYAYRRKLSYIIGFILLMATSLFWFDAPSIIPDQVSGYLEWEKQLFFVNENPWPLILLSGAVIVFLVSLFYAFWKRNIWYGVIVANVGTILKIIVSVTLDPQSGTAAILPSVTSMLVVNIIAYLVWRKYIQKSRA